MFDFSSAKQTAEMLMNLNKTLGELTSSCEALGSALEKQDNRIRLLEEKFVELRADMKVQSAELSLTATEKAVETSTSLVSGVHTSMMQEVFEMKRRLDMIASATATEGENPNVLSEGKISKLTADP